MINTTLTGTWIEAERELRDGETIACTDAEVLLSVPANGAWENYGTMRAYGDVVVGGPLRLISMGIHENLNADAIVSAYRDGDAFVVTTSYGHRFRLETFGEPERAKRSSFVANLAPVNIARGIGAAIQNIFRS